MAVTRLVSLADAETLASEYRANREFLVPWSPVRPDAYFTAEAQRAIVAKELEAYAREATLPMVILDGGGRLAGRIYLNGITRGAFQSASVGYWVSQARGGRGLASAAVAEVIEVAFKDLGLHRLQAETLLYNVPSQRVLTRNGFKPFGVAPSYLEIAGEWQDHIMFQLLNENFARFRGAVSSPDSSPGS
jgi:ribosomal-protein-alanine N-acetyltransferase